MNTAQAATFLTDIIAGDAAVVAVSIDADDVLVRLTDEIELRVTAQDLQQIASEDSDEERAALAHLVQRKLLVAFSGQVGGGRRQLVAVAVPAGELRSTSELLRRPIPHLPGMDLVLCLDDEESTVWLTAAMIDEMGLDEDEAFSQAQTTLLEGLPGSYAYGAGPATAASFSVGDDHGAVRAVLFPQQTAAVFCEHDIKAPWVLCVPNRELAVMTSASDPEHLRRVVEQCAYDYRIAVRPTLPGPLLVEEDGTVTGMFAVTADGLLEVRPLP